MVTETTPDKVSKPNIVYQRKKRLAVTAFLQSVIPPLVPDPKLIKTGTTFDDLPIALCKPSRSRTCHPISSYVSDEYSQLHIVTLYWPFLLSISQNYRTELQIPQWKNAMDEEIVALHNNQTWSFTSLPNGKTNVGRRWVYTVKYNLNGSVKHLKV